MTGSPDLLTATFPLAPNVAYSLVITLTDPNGSSTYNTTFGTYAANNYTFEAEDFDYGNGLFFDNPQVNDYAGLTGTDGVDGHNTSTGVGTAYRPADPSVLGKEVNGAAPRAQYLAAGTNDYDIGWTAAGNWANYTRTYPKGEYNVYLRASSPNGQAAGASLWQVTSGLGTADQTTNKLGIFNFPVTGGWQTYQFVPLVNSNTNLVVITNSGAVSTFRLYQDTGGYNLNFLMLVPAAPVVSHSALSIGLVNGTPSITFTGTFQSSSNASGPYQDLSGATSPYTPPTTGSAAFYRSRQ